MSTMLPAIDPGEWKIATFDFTNEIPEGVEITGSPVVQVTMEAGSDAGSADTLNGSATVSGPLVRQMVIGRVDGNVYKLKCQATLTNGEKPIIALSLPVRAS